MTPPGIRVVEIAADPVHPPADTRAPAGTDESPES